MRKKANTYSGLQYILGDKAKALLFRLPYVTVEFWVRSVLGYWLFGSGTFGDHSLFLPMCIEILLMSKSKPALRSTEQTKKRY